MAKRDYYEILGVNRNATPDELKKAYRKMAMQFHPDRNPGDKESEEKFKEAAEAYDVLTDKEKKDRYDRFGHQGMSGNGGGQGGGFSGGGMNMEDIFSHFGDVFGGHGGGGGSPFESFFSGGRSSGSQRNRGVRGGNLRIKISLTLKEVAEGAQKKLKVKKYITCDTCHGNGAKDKSSFSTCNTCKGSGHVRRVTNTILGQMQTTTTCPTCNGEGQSITAKCTTCKGEGRMWGEETITVDIPAGVTEGIQLSMGGRGNSGERGGPNGDLVIQIEEIPSEDLKRDGINIIYDLHISFMDAALGTSVEVPTIDGRAKIKIKPGTQAGEIFRLKGKGLPNLNAYGKGDELIYVNIWTPKTLNGEEEKILEKLKTHHNFQPDHNKSEKSFFEKMKDYFN
ncbi:MAG: molecular chaperone DnaJ [Sphingobacteriales bacterium]|nr:MAG: molecular chaperone DnaJ [Sphingobacteriales bacterium]